MCIRDSINAEYGERKNAPLMQALVPLQSELGSDLVAECEKKREGNPSQYELVAPCWSVQEGLRTCGVASTKIVLNSRRDIPVLESSVLCPETSESDLPAEELARFRDQVDQSGMTLPELHTLCDSFSALRPVSVLYAEDCDEEEFFRQVLEALADPGRRVLLNYHMSTLGQEPFGGHVSPVVAYHQGTESLLIMDTWPQTEPVWAARCSVWAAVCHVDGVSKRSRGVVICGTSTS
eukprot:TRINITY_DN14642_c0_g1_i2.p1 TRINITY_DN14642_c0_g1~~TRINITY_DN14642_c0_g1_i2.p1  ORF type:complete len:236 (+),score=52.06 TRINITY_DN14642_c0_g1_i2:124-831(+)